jgi:hypothetical protein
MKAFVVVAKLVVGGIIGWWLTGFVTDRIEVKIVVAVLLGYFCTTYFVQVFIGILFHLRPEGGNLPARIPREGYKFNSELVAARYVVRSAPPETFAKGLARSAELVRSEAAQLTRAGYAETAREILDFRTPFSGDERAQAAWATVIDAARTGIAEGEGSSDEGCTKPSATLPDPRLRDRRPDEL